MVKPASGKTAYCRTVADPSFVKLNTGWPNEAIDINKRTKDIKRLIKR